MTKINLKRTAAAIGILAFAAVGAAPGSGKAPNADRAQPGFFKR